MSSEAIEELITQRVADALETYKTNRNTRNGNENGNGIGSGSQSDGESGSKRIVHTARGCTIVGHDAAYNMSWKDLMKMMIEAYCSRNRIQKLESELWNLTGQADNKRRTEKNPRDNHVTQPTFKRQNVARAYTAGPGEKSGYAGNYHSECPTLRNQNRGNQAGSSESRKMVYALGGGEADKDPINIANNVDA
nr:hypothetical protein [Tanacetum cinerariifolium]